LARRRDTPCSGCGKLLWSGSTSAPADRRLCRDCRRAPKPAAEPAEPVPEPPAWLPAESGLGERGRRLYRDFTASGPPLGPGERVLLEEACRIADRCDQLDDFLRGHGDVWLRFASRNDDGSVVEVVVDKALSEARQQAGTLKALVAQVAAMRGKQEAPAAKEANPLDELARRRSERRTGAAGQ
jgi:hypothetical protein